tara:strand:- start:15 stop:458 length:444 start_codon:yes stop_codon:yes gene_type:complete
MVFKGPDLIKDDAAFRRGFEEPVRTRKAAFRDGQSQPNPQTIDITQRTAYTGAILSSDPKEEISFSSQHDPSANEADILGAALMGTMAPSTHTAMGAAQLSEEVEISRGRAVPQHGWKVERKDQPSLFQPHPKAGDVRRQSSPRFGI